MLVQLNKCFVVCGSEFQRGHSGDGCFSSLILLKYESSRGHFFVLSWARVLLLLLYCELLVNFAAFLFIVHALLLFQVHP